MERPSHIIFDTQSHYFSRRLPWIGLAFTLQFAMFWLFTHGLAGHRIADIIRDIEVVPVTKREVVESLKPPEPVLTKPQTVKLEPPLFTTDRNPGEKTISVEEGQKEAMSRPVGPDRAPLGIASTHTVPPYPPIARRIGAEGKVTLRLTVSPDGRVSQADIVTSSGRADLDQTAQQWIVAHWIYKPALDHGVPAISQSLATVTFSLTNAH
jgi:periplasmic protein TonB